MLRDTTSMTHFVQKRKAALFAVRFLISSSIGVLTGIGAV
jgi:hypothetical protein